MTNAYDRKLKGIITYWHKTHSAIGAYKLIYYCSSVFRPCEISENSYESKNDFNIIIVLAVSIRYNTYHGIIFLQICNFSNTI